MLGYLYGEKFGSRIAWANGSDYSRAKHGSIDQ